LESSSLAELADSAGLGAGARGVHIMSGGAENLSLHVSLSAEDSTGRRTHTAGPDFGISGPRNDVWHRWHGPSRRPMTARTGRRLALARHRVDLHDIEDGINQMLGRDPSLHRPPRLSWYNLIRALDDAGIRVTERELIDVPLIIELTPEVQAELSHV
jgi:hypothetical protein